MKWSVKRAGEAAELSPVQPMAVLGELMLDPPVSDAQQRSLDLKVSIHRALLDKINLSVLEKLPREKIRAEIAAGQVDRLATRMSYVYKRQGEPCRVCGSRIRTRVVAGRNLFWCGRCQRRR